MWAGMQNKCHPAPIAFIPKEQPGALTSVTPPPPAPPYRNTPLQHPAPGLPRKEAIQYSSPWRDQSLGLGST